MAKKKEKGLIALDAKRIQKHVVYKSELQRLERDNGLITPQIVVDEARKEDSPLHGIFDWDDESASEKYRLFQARALLTMVKVEVRGLQVGAFVNVLVNVENVPTRAYISTERAIAEPNLNRQIVEQATREIEYWQKKYSTFQEFEGVINTQKLSQLKETVNE